MRLSGRGRLPSGKSAPPIVTCRRSGRWKQRSEMKNDLPARLDPVIFDTKCKGVGEADFSGYPDATAATEGRKIPHAAAPPELGQPSHLQTYLGDVDAPLGRC